MTICSLQAPAAQPDKGARQQSGPDASHTQLHGDEPAAVDASHTDAAAAASAAFQPVQRKKGRRRGKHGTSDMFAAATAATAASLQMRAAPDMPSASRPAADAAMSAAGAQLLSGVQTRMHVITAAVHATKRLIERSAANRHLGAGEAQSSVDLSSAQEHTLNPAAQHSAAQQVC